MSAAAIVLAAAAVIAGGVAGSCLAATRLAHLRRAQRKDAALGSAHVKEEETFALGGACGWALRYMRGLTRKLFTGATEPLAPSVRKGTAEATRAGRRYRDLAREAGCSRDISVRAYCEARTRLAVSGLLGGALAGTVLSVELAVLLGALGAYLGGSLPARAVSRMRRERAIGAERHLSEMLEVLALGLRSGLTFDRSFALYGSHFDGEFAQSCAQAHRRWALGLTTREEALRDLAASYDCDQLARVVDSIVRSLRFGTSLTGPLAEAAVQSRATYRAALEERVAKAPVKMMLPTGTLILPAMLLLVIGPILLELAGGF